MANENTSVQPTPQSTPSPVTNPSPAHSAEQTPSPQPAAGSANERKSGILEGIRQHLGFNREQSSEPVQTSESPETQQHAEGNPTPEPVQQQPAQPVQLPPEVQQQLYQAQLFQTMIQANPVMREEFERITQQQQQQPEQQQTAAFQTQTYQAPADAWYGGFVADPATLPTLDPYADTFESDLREHGKILVRDIVGDMLAQALAPYQQALQQVVPFVQDVYQERQTTQHQNASQQLHDEIYKHLPEAKNSQAHFQLMKANLIQAENSPMFVNGQVTWQQAVAWAASETQKMLNGFTPAVPTGENPNPNVPNPSQTGYVEPARNTSLIGDRTVGNSRAENIHAHLNRPGARQPQRR